MSRSVLMIEPHLEGSFGLQCCATDSRLVRRLRRVETLQTGGGFAPPMQAALTRLVQDSDG
jgi:hypothetical protein